MMVKIFGRVAEYLRMIRFSHTIFALPFAYSGALIGGQRNEITFSKIFWITAAMIGARSAAMGFNRLIDRRYDARNERTVLRALPQKRIGTKETALLILFSLALFLLSAWKLGSLAFYLSPLAVVIVLGYSYTKRITHFTHFFLGLALAIAPVGAYIGITGKIHLSPLLLAAGVLLWTAGFDIIYAAQDYEFDRQEGLYSLVVKLGIKKALQVSTWLHVISLVFFFSLFFFVLSSIFFAVTMLCIAALVVYQHLIVSESDISKVNRAFFTTNAVISVLFFVGTALSLYI